MRDPRKAYEAFLRRKAVGQLGPRYNLAPGQVIPVVRAEESGGRELVELAWGFIPRWTRPGEKPRPMINARAETAVKKPAFRSAFRHRRCLIPADGFYEWQDRSGRKQPYFFRLRRDRPFAFAGLWEEWRSEAGKTIRTFCILTTEANAKLAEVHDRMPVLLEGDGATRWLEATPGEAATEFASLWRPFPSEEMEAMPVNSWVNKVAHEGPRCLEPPEGDDPEQLSLL